MKRNQSGFTLIEISFVLVIGVLLLLGIIKAQAYINDTKSKNEVDNVLFIKQHVQAKYGSQPSTATLTTTSGILGNVFPATMTWTPNTGTTVTNQFNSAVSLTSITLTVANDAFKLTEAGLPDAVCQAVAKQLVPYANSISSGSGVLYNNYIGNSTPYDPATGDALCNSGSAGNTLNISFYKN